MFVPVARQSSQIHTKIPQKAKTKIPRYSMSKAVAKLRLFGKTADSFNQTEMAQTKTGPSLLSLQKCRTISKAVTLIKINNITLDKQWYQKAAYLNSIRYDANKRLLTLHFCWLTIKGSSSEKKGSRIRFWEYVGEWLSAGGLIYI